MRAHNCKRCKRPTSASASFCPTCGLSVNLGNLRIQHTPNTNPPAAPESLRSSRTAPAPKFPAVIAWTIFAALTAAIASPPNGEPRPESARAESVRADRHGRRIGLVFDFPADYPIFTWFNPNDRAADFDQSKSSSSSNASS